MKSQRILAKLKQKLFLEKLGKHIEICRAPSIVHSIEEDCGDKIKIQYANEMSRDKLTLSASTLSQVKVAHRAVEAEKDKMEEETKNTTRTSYIRGLKIGDSGCYHIHDKVKNYLD